MGCPATHTTVSPAFSAPFSISKRSGYATISSVEVVSDHRAHTESRLPQPGGHCQRSERGRTGGREHYDAFRAGRLSGPVCGVGHDVGAGRILALPRFPQSDRRLRLHRDPLHHARRLHRIPPGRVLARQHHGVGAIVNRVGKSHTSARVGYGWSIIESSIWVAVMTNLPHRPTLRMIAFWMEGTFSSATSTPRSPRATHRPNTIPRGSSRDWSRPRAFRFSR
jgi:hypothetical protein